MEQVAHNLLKKVKVYRELDDSDRDSFTWLTHFAFGAAAGAIFPFLTAKKEKHAALKGVGLGLTVWATSYIAALPALDIMPAPTRQPKQHVALEVVAHVVWGAALAYLAERILIKQAD
jgi:uncharacterized membrane protein YagU involved in acid resistance